MVINNEDIATIFGAKAKTDIVMVFMAMVDGIGHITALATRSALREKLILVATMN